MGNKKRKSRSAILAKKTAKLCKQQDYRCYYCKYPILARTDMFGDVPGVAMNEILPPVGWDFATFDHKVPKSQGGTASIDNGVACCVSCNYSRGSVKFKSWCKNARKNPYYRIEIHNNRLNRLRRLAKRQQQFLLLDANIIYIQIVNKEARTFKVAG